MKGLSLVCILMCVFNANAVDCGFALTLHVCQSHACAAFFALLVCSLSMWAMSASMWSSIPV